MEQPKCAGIESTVDLPPPAKRVSPASILCSAALCEARLTSGGARPRAFALLHITSQRFQPGEQVGFSPGWWRTVEIRWLTRLQGCAFHLEVDFDVRVCCFDAGVA